MIDSGVDVLIEVFIEFRRDKSLSEKLIHEVDILMNSHAVECDR